MRLATAHTIGAAEGPLHRWDPRFKLVGLFVLVFAFATIQELSLLPFIAVTALAVYTLSGMSYGYLASRLRVPGLFLIALALVLPFFSGETPIAQIGPIVLRREGTLALLTIGVRFFSIITVATALFASTPMPRLAGAMRSLGIPSLLGDLLLFTYRYIFQLADDLGRARTAARLRGARSGSRRSLRTIAHIVGSLLVRSHAQAERVLSAMLQRGYGNRHTSAVADPPRAVDAVALAACALVAGALVVTQTVLM